MITVIIFYLSLNILSEETFSFAEKLEMVMLTPLMYFLFYILSMVEYVALIKSWVNMPKLRTSLLNQKQSWQPITRSGFRDDLRQFSP